MECQRPTRQRAFVATILGLFGAIFNIGTASAHVKWFCAYNVAGQPRGLENVLCADFEILMLTSFSMLLFGYVVEWSPLGAPLLNALNRVTNGLGNDAETIIRGACGFFFVSVWMLGGIILTPELKTSSQMIP